MDGMKKWYLQFFAEDPNGDNGGKDPDGSDPSGKNPDGEKKYTDEDVNRIIDKKFAEWAKKQEKEVSEAQRLANLSAEEKAKEEHDKLIARIEKMESERTRLELVGAAREILAKDKIVLPDSLIANLVGEDADATNKNVTSFKTAFQAAVQDGIKAALKGKTPPAGSSSTITKEDIMKVKDSRERQKLIRENMDLFKPN